MDEVEDQDGGLDLAWTSACSRATTTKTMASSLSESCLRPAARERAERARALVTAIYSRDRRRFRRPRNRGGGGFGPGLGDGRGILAALAGGCRP